MVTPGVYQTETDLSNVIVNDYRDAVLVNDGEQYNFFSRILGVRNGNGMVTVWEAYTIDIGYKPEPIETITEQEFIEKYLWI